MARKAVIPAVSDEELVAAVLSNGTIKDAAAAVGLSSRTVSDRMQHSEFQALYSAAKTDMIRTAVFSINGKLIEAVNTISDLMTDTDVNPAIRLQAAQTMLKYSEGLATRLATNERQTQSYCNKFSLFD